MCLARFLGSRPLAGSAMSDVGRWLEKQGISESDFLFLRKPCTVKDLTKNLRKFFCHRYSNCRCRLRSLAGEISAAPLGAPKPLSFRTRGERGYLIGLKSTPNLPEIHGVRLTARYRMCSSNFR